MREKFKFPSRGFYIVADKIAEADYFLEKMRETQFSLFEFSYNLSAFASAARSITFSLQAVMSKYPEFSDWYLPHQLNLKNNELAKYFVNLRNHILKVGEMPVRHAGAMRFGKLRSMSHFVDVDGLRNSPDGEVISLAETYFTDILKVIESCYRDYWAYIDPRAIFTEKGLEILGWTIEDIEEAFGLPRGWTDIPYEGDDKNFQRLRLLERQFGGDEQLEQYFDKYKVGQGAATQ
ncbi:hypothetical protein [Pseudoduganella sp. HUAS MS19]